MASNSCLPEAMIEEILLRLPVKSLLRFQAVCKHWLALITSSKFIATHYCHYSSKQSILLTDYWHLQDHFVMSFLSDTRGIRLEHKNLPSSMIYKKKNCRAQIMGSSNGLLCLYFFNNEEVSFYLWNPATRKYWLLPSPFSRRFSRPPSFLGFFSFHPETNDYKLLIVDSPSSNKVRIAKVLTLRTGYWKQVSGIFPTSGRFGSLPSSVVLKGMWYQMVRENKNGWFIVKFDMGNDAFLKMEVDVSPLASASDVRLMVYKELIAISLSYLNTKEVTTKIEIWTMKNECWTKQFTSPLFPESIVPFGVWNDKDIILRGFSFGCFNLKLYDPLTQKMKMVQSTKFFTQAHNYVESLVSVYGTTRDEVADDDERNTKRELSAEERNTLPLKRKL